MTQERDNRKPTQWPLIRDVMLFCSGLAGVLHETIITDVERPTLLLLFAAMLGLPAFLRQDERKRNRDDPYDAQDRDAQ